MTFILILLAFLCSGCLGDNLSNVIKELGDNTSTVCVTINTVYGTGKALRTNVDKGKVKCDMDGMSVDTSGVE